MTALPPSFFQKGFPCIFSSFMAPLTDEAADELQATDLVSCLDAS
jgi:hypothetical protein